MGLGLRLGLFILIAKSLKLHQGDSFLFLFMPLVKLTCDSLLGGSFTLGFGTGLLGGGRSNELLAAAAGKTDKRQTQFTCTE